MNRTDNTVEAVSEGRGTRYVDGYLRHYHQTCEAAVDAFIARMREEARFGTVSERHALFVESIAGWRTIVIDIDGEALSFGDHMVWAVNRMARILEATVAATVQYSTDGSSSVCVERRDAPALEIYELGRGTTPVRRRLVVGNPFELLPGGSLVEGRGRQDHDGLKWKWI